MLGFWWWRPLQVPMSSWYSTLWNSLPRLLNSVKLVLCRTKIAPQWMRHWVGLVRCCWIIAEHCTICWLERTYQLRWLTENPAATAAAAAVPRPPGVFIYHTTFIHTRCLKYRAILYTWKTWNTRGFLWTWKTLGILREFCEFCATSGKNCNKQSIFSLSIKCLCKTAVDWVNRVIMTLDEGHYYIYFFVAITYGKVSLWLWKSLENSGNFSPSLWPPCCICR